MLEQPLRLRYVHADATVRERVADRAVLRRAVDADAGGAQPHPARAERVAGTGRDGLLALRPRRVRRIPPRVLPLHDDLELAERRRIDGLAGRDAELPYDLHAVVERQQV